MEAGGGIPNGHAFKAVQTGGPSGGCLPIEHLNVPLDFESMGKIGGLMGSGGFIIVDDTVCMVDLGWYFTRFNRGESCGKCTPCRIGTKAHLEILNRIVNGQGREEDIDLLVSSGHQIVELSLCGLGQTAPLPVLGGIKYFRDEYEAHVRGYCPTGVCPALKPGPVPVEAGA